MGLILLRVKGECALSRSRELDLPGLVLYSLSILLLMVGFSSLPRIAGSAFVAGGGLTLGLFILRERRTEKPAVDLRLFTKNPVFARASLTALLFNTSNFAVIFLLSLYLQDIRGFDARYSGTVLLTLVIFMALFSPYAGRLSDRRAPRAVIGTGIILSTAGLLVLLSLGEDSPLSAIVIALAIMGTGFALFQSPLLRTLVSSVPRDRYGLASGFAETMRLVGMTVSIAIATLVFGFTIGGVHVSPEIAPAFIAAMRLIFGIFLGFSLAALAVSLLLKRGSADPESRA
jgi:predicted MFS family arabinose efflux permease